MSMLLLPLFIASASFSLAYLRNVLFADHSLPPLPSPPLVLFSLVFSLALIPFTTLILTTTLGPATASLSTLVIILTIIIPTLLVTTTTPIKRIALATAGLTTLLLLPAPSRSPTIMSTLLSKLAVLGVTTAAILSGYGAAEAPFSYMTRFLSGSSASECVARESRSRAHLLHAMRKLRLKWVRLASLRATLDPSSVWMVQGTNAPATSATVAPSSPSAVAGTSSGSSIRSFFGSLLTGVSGSSSTEAEAAQLGDEIVQLQSVTADLYGEIERLRYERERLRFSATLRGRAYNVAGYGFAAYCAYKLVMSFANIVFDRHASTDPITRGLQLALAFTPLELDVHFWSQTFSMLMVGGIAFSSVRGFLQRLLSTLSSFSAGVQPLTLVLIITEVMGCYFLSSFLLLRTSLPPAYRAKATAMLGADLEFDFYHRWFDAIFLPSALATLALNLVQRRVLAFSSSSGTSSTSASSLT
mmetsp:Transcript_6559/g.21237  ORF Transcript_6559/g.21237 Transcript_6559/m.21237 type:complete len:472 (-) Transcript_6559:880-2295(-)